jgi:hypothetical protein
VSAATTAIVMNTGMRGVMMADMRGGTTGGTTTTEDCRL